MKAGRTTNIASIIPLLGAFVGAAVVMGLLGCGLIRVVASLRRAGRRKHRAERAAARGLTLDLEVRLMA